MIKHLMIIYFLITALFSNTYKFNIEKIASGLNVVWGMSLIDDKNLLFSTKDGNMAILDLNSNKIKYLLNVPSIYFNGQAGLLDIQKSPNFSKDKKIYFTYVKPLGDNGVTTLAMAKLVDNKLIDIKDLLVTKSLTTTSRHYGSRITFDESGHLYFSVGDRGVRETAQDLKNHAGTVIRLNLDGTIPRDNPFYNRKDALAEIYSYGHRNPQGLYFDKKTDRLWSIEHGPRGGDEINLIEAGKNYGWPIISYGKEYWNPFPVGESTHKQGMEQPIKYYDPSIAPSSLIVYLGEEFSNWNGDLISGALKLRHLNKISIDKNLIVTNEQRLFDSLKERIRNIIQSSKGILYISTDSGNIYKISKRD